MTRKKAEPISIEARALAAAKAAYTGPHAASLWVDIFDKRKLAVCVLGADGRGRCCKAVIGDQQQIDAVATYCAIGLTERLRDGR